MAGAANLLIFEADGSIHADNTDGPGLLGALEEQAPGFDVSAAPVVILGAGGAARGAIAALLLAGAPKVGIVNRTLSRAPRNWPPPSAIRWSPSPSRTSRPAGRCWPGDQRHLAGLGGGDGPVASLTLTPETR
jgi:shikimate dehydrogenase